MLKLQFSEVNAQRQGCPFLYFPPGRIIIIRLYLPL